MGISDDSYLFGLFRGLSLQERSFFDGSGHGPHQIVLFKEELEECCASRQELVQEITLTLLHEVGHYLGLGEDELVALEDEIYAKLEG